MLQKLGVLWSDRLILHEAEVDKVDEVNCEDVFYSIVIGRQLGRITVYHLKTEFQQKSPSKDKLACVSCSNTEFHLG